MVSKIEPSTFFNINVILYHYLLKVKFFKLFIITKVQRSFFILLNIKKDTKKDILSFSYLRD